LYFSILAAFGYFQVLPLCLPLTLSDPFTFRFGSASNVSKLCDLVRREHVHLVARGGNPAGSGSSFRFANQGFATFTGDAGAHRDDWV
jgi:hypothetical protein